MSTPRLLRAAAAVALVLAASTVAHAVAAVEVDARVVTAWTNECILGPTVCNTIATLSPFGYPNIGGFQSVSATAAPGQAAADALVSLVSTMGLPSIWLAYYQQAAQWNYTFDWSKLVIGFNADASASFTASAFATGFAIPRVIEFVDVNGNRQYDPKVDTVASTYEFADATTLFPRRWAPMVKTTKKVVADSGNEATLFSFNATTVDGVFSIRWNMCSAQYTYPNTNGVMVTPNNTKIDVQIANFPFTRSDTYLALDTVLTGAQATANGNTGAVDAVALGALGRVDWLTTASASVTGDMTGANKIAVAASKVLKATAAEIGAQSLFAAAVGGQAGVTYNRVYYSFDKANASFIYWDPSVGFGMPPLSPPAAAAVWIAVGVTVGVLVLAAFGTFFYRDKLRQTSCVQSSPCLTRCFAPSNEYVAM